MHSAYGPIIMFALYLFSSRQKVMSPTKQCLLINLL